MIMNRSREIAFGITFAILISMAAFYLEGIEINPQITGHAVKETEEKASHVIVHGTEFKASIDGEEYWYIFSDEGWYETKEWIDWEKKEEMGNLWEGLYYLKSYDADIYHDEKKVDDITEFAREYR